MLPVGQAHRRHREALAEPDRGRADRTTSAIAGVEYRAVGGELDVGVEMVGEAEAVRRPEFLQRRGDVGSEGIWWCLVVVGESRLERALGDPRDRL